jgi:hypothetical protein
MAAFEYEIVENIGVLSSRGAWNLELNLVKWGNGSPSFDLRKWDADHTRMSKGCTLNRAELIALRDLLNTMELE